MKHIIILGDGMADLPVERLGGKTLLQYAHKPMMDQLAREGRCGRLITVPEGFPPGSEVANTAILGYDLNKVYEGRGPLEAASIGYEMADDDFAIRCNIITLADGKIITHNGGNLETDDARVLIDYLNETLAKPINERAGCERVKFITGIQYRHLLVIKGGSKHIVCAPPHDHPNEAWRPLLVKAEACPEEPNRLTPQQTADLLNELILKSQDLLASHPFNIERAKRGERQANSIWPWSGGYRPFDGDADATISADKVRHGHLCRRPHTRHRPLCRSEDRRGGRCYRTGQHQLRRQGSGSHRGPRKGRLRLRPCGSQRRGWSRRRPGTEAEDHRVSRPAPDSPHLPRGVDVGRARLHRRTPRPPDARRDAYPRRTARAVPHLASRHRC